MASKLAHWSLMKTPSAVRYHFLKTIGRTKHEDEEWVKILMSVCGQWSGYQSARYAAGRITRRIGKLLADDPDARAAFEASWRLGGAVAVKRWVMHIVNPPKPKLTKDEALELARVGRSKAALVREKYVRRSLLEAEQSLDDAHAALKKAQERVKRWRQRVRAYDAKNRKLQCQHKPASAPIRARPAGGATAGHPDDETTRLPPPRAAVVG